MIKIDERPLGISGRVEQLCRLAKEMQEAGDYEGARSTLVGLWERVGDRPNLDGLNRRTQAEVLLLVGTLSGWIGSAHQITGAQEFAKDLISESGELFAVLGLEDKVAEARIDLAICYWREGALDEARVLFKEVLAQLSDWQNELKARALLNSTLVEVSSKRYREAFDLLTEATPLFERINNHAAKGRFHNELALVLRNLGEIEKCGDYTDRALVEYAAAGFHLEQAGHTRYLARVENNVGYLLFTLGRFTEAHEHLNRARQLFINLKDSGSVAQVNETRARAFLAQGRYVEAERAASGAVHTLEKGDEQSLLTEALATQGIAMARLGETASAHRVLTRAAEIAARSNDLDAACRAYMTVVEELHDRLPAEEVVDGYMNADHMLNDSPPVETLNRLRSCARLVMVSAGSGRGKVNFDEFLVGGSLDDEVTRFEGELIRRALDEAGGSITKAARLLGTSHQSLAYTLQARHKNLLAARTPVRPRRRSLIKNSGH